MPKKSSKFPPTKIKKNKTPRLLYLVQLAYANVIACCWFHIYHKPHMCISSGKSCDLCLGLLVYKALVISID